MRFTSYLFCLALLTISNFKESNTYYIITNFYYNTYPQNLFFMKSLNAGFHLLYNPIFLSISMVVEPIKHYVNFIVL